MRFCLAVPVGWALLMLACGLGLGALVTGGAGAALGREDRRRRLHAVAGLEAGQCAASSAQVDAARLNVSFGQGVGCSSSTSRPGCWR